MEINRLNYIGSKFQLLEWITSYMKEKTGWVNFKDKIIGDFFSGTGIVSYHFRKEEAIVLSNDSELYSSIIAHAFTRSIYTDRLNEIFKMLNEEIQTKERIGFITEKYSPYQGERMFFTIENAKKIDYLRQRLEELELDDDEYKFMLASLIISADSISNVPAVYGCYLKNFKAKALKTLVLNPIHNITQSSSENSKTTNSDIISLDLETDLVYLDPPYNERQYSKNYFPLNIIAKNPVDLENQVLTGKTGIPTDCFLSSFCKKREAEKSFDILISKLKTKWVFLSYSSEGIVSKEKMIELMKKYGEVSLIERDYKRFKSFEYNKDVEIKEYLFCLQINNI
jgi:adenine-specific DNA-methyltransferase